RHGGGTEGVAGGQHQAVAFLLVAPRKLADGRGLADAVDAHGQDHERFGRGVDLQRPGHRFQQAHHFRAQAGGQGAGVGERARLHPLAHGLDQAGGGGDADVGHRQRGLDLVEQVVVEFRVAREQPAQAAGEAAAAQAFAPALPAGRGGGRRRGGGRGGGRRRRGFGYGYGFGYGLGLGFGFGGRRGLVAFREGRGQFLDAEAAPAAVRLVGIGFVASEPARHCDPGNLMGENGG